MKNLLWCMSMRFKILALVICFIVIACKQSSSKNELEGTLTKTELPEGFLEFLDKFSTDTAYQKRHIIWPAAVERAKEEKNDEPFTEYIDSTNWIYHHKFEDAGGTFQRSFVVFNGIVTELTQDSNGMFNMKRRFSQIGGEWMMIYYKEMGY
jgi:hypothetical protein